jgi:hypothetical protein
MEQFNQTGAQVSTNYWAHLGRGVCSCYLGGKSQCRAIIWTKVKNPRRFFTGGVEPCLDVLELP